MKTAAIVLDNRKIPIFKKHLEAAGYTYTELSGPLTNCSTLTVPYEWVHKLQPVVKAANDECRHIT